MKPMKSGPYQEADMQDTDLSVMGSFPHHEKIELPNSQHRAYPRTRPLMSKQNGQSAGDRHPAQLPVFSLEYSDWHQNSLLLYNNYYFF